jgi:hypothetical protein
MTNSSKMRPFYGVSAEAAAGAQERIGELPWISGVRLVGFLGGGQRPGWAHSWHAYTDRAPSTRRCLTRHPAGPGIAGGRVVELGAALLCFGSSHALTIARRATAPCEPGLPVQTVVAVAQGVPRRGPGSSRSSDCGWSCLDDRLRGRVVRNRGYRQWSVVGLAPGERRRRSLRASFTERVDPALQAELVAVARRRGAAARRAADRMEPVEIVIEDPHRGRQRIVGRVLPPQQRRGDLDEIEFGLRERSS